MLADIKPDKEHSCCFTGHRIISKKNSEQLKKRIKAEIFNLYLSGINIFISGGALGFDMLCEQCIKEMRDENPSLDIKLFLYFPCTDQDRYWSYADKFKYNMLKCAADGFIFVTRSYYTDDCMKKRNYRMVDDSSHCIAYFSGKAGGTMQTVNYAKKNNLKIINLYEK